MTYIPVDQTTLIQQSLKLDTPPVMRPKLARHPRPALHAWFVGSIKDKDRQDGLLEKGGKLEKDCAQERVLAVLRQLGVEYP
jgi:hypothetical protein